MEKVGRVKGAGTYMVLVINTRIKPAGAIAILALLKSVDIYQETYPVISYQLKYGSYADDVGITGKGKEDVKRLTGQCDEILKHGNRKIEHWIYSGSSQGKISQVPPRAGNKDGQSVLKEGSNEKRMLGVSWFVKEDASRFKVRINLSPIKIKVWVGPD